MRFRAMPCRISLRMIEICYKFKSRQPMKISILIPVYNELATIEQVLANLVAVPIPKEIIVVGSAGGTSTL